MDGYESCNCGRRGSRNESSCKTEKGESAGLSFTPRGMIFLMQGAGFRTISGVLSKQERN